MSSTLLVRERRPEYRANRVPDLTRAVCTIRGERVMLAHDLAALYRVEPRALIQAVMRNRARFPDDFMFQLSAEEATRLKSQSVISNPVGRGGRRTRPYAFTEQGVAMLSSVLRSEHAIQVNIAIMRLFVQMRRLAMTHIDLARRLDALEARYDGQFRDVFEAIRRLMEPPVPPKPRIGFQRPAE